MNRFRLYAAGLVVLPAVAGGVGVLAGAAGAAWGVALALLACVLMGGAGIWWARRAVVLPMRQAVSALERVARGEVSELRVPGGSDPLGELGDAVRRVAGKLEEFRTGGDERLARTRQVTQTAIDSLPHAIAMLSADGRVDLANAPAVKLFGMVPGSRVDALSHRWLSDMFRSIRDSPRRLEPRGYDSAVQMFDTTGERIFLPHLVPIQDENGTLTGVTVVLVDATQLHRIDEAKSSLISTVSHELKTPLTSIQMCLHMALEDASLSPRQRELVDTARQDADRLGQIIESLLDMGRLQAGRAELHLDAVTVAGLVEEGISPLHAAIAAGELTLIRVLPAGLPAVVADRARMRHVFENLFSNAAKYTPSGGRVTVSAEATATHVLVKVQDTGTGIPPEYLALIFEKFVRVPRDAGAPGAGLGLAIAREIVEAHGGTIVAESAAGKGATFTLSLRRADVG